MSPLTLLALACAPGLALIVYVYLKDEYDREPILLLIWAFVLGVFSTVPAILLESAATGLGFSESSSALMNFFFAFGIVGFSEEVSKLLMILVFIYRNKNFDEPFDGIVYAVMVSMGFATLENILYVWEGGVHVAMVRMFTAVPAHATFAVIMGYYIGIAKFHPREKWRYIFMGLGGAIIFHGAYDFFLFNQINTGIVGGAMLSLVVAIYLSRQAMKLHLARSPFNPESSKGD